MVEDYQKILLEYKNALLKSLSYLKYSYQKIQNLSMQLKDADPELLETWEGFVARFARVTDIFVAKYLRIRILLDNPDFRGSLRDLLNQAEKMNLIQDARQWMRIRDLRNQATHEYSEKELEPYLQEIKKLTPIVLAIEKIL